MKNSDVTSKSKYYRLEEKFEHLDVSILVANFLFNGNGNIFMFIMVIIDTVLVCLIKYYFHFKMICMIF